LRRHYYYPLQWTPAAFLAYKAEQEIDRNQVLKTVMDAFENIDLFRELDAEDFARLRDASSERHFATGQAVSAFGARADHMYYLRCGQIKLHRNDEKGQEAVLGIVTEGEWFFALSAFFPIRAPADATALKKSDVILIPADKIRDVMCRDAAFAEKILTYTAKNIHGLTDKVADMSLKTPVQRVSYYLLKEFLKNGATETSFQLPYKKSLIAGELGMTAETFSRALAVLKEAGVKIEKKRVTLPHINALCRVCDPGVAQNCPHHEPGRCPEP